MEPTKQQQRVLDKIVNFINEDAFGVFILKGYAGTGKTTLLKFLVDYLKKENSKYQLMAPTGRAAKVLRDKLDSGLTIHKSIYNYSDLQCFEIESEDLSKKTFHYKFPVRSPSIYEDAIEVIIVDESSMISNIETHLEFFTFGTGRIMDDLFTYAKNFRVSKIIFVGDDAQLPPVTDNKSIALIPEYFSKLGYAIQCDELTEVVRQSSDSGILDASTNIRKLLSVPYIERESFELKSNDRDIRMLETNMVIDSFLEQFSKPEVGNGVIVCYSNSSCYEYNTILRERMFGGTEEIRPGDILMINNNNYYTFGRDVYNGDMAKVISVGETETHSDIPVFKKGGEKKYVSLSFITLELLFPDSPKVISCKILKSLLNSKERDITAIEQRALYIDFCMRNRNLKEGTEEFKLAIRDDKYFNVLRAKYGYAITCHKAQGGEWKTVFVDYKGRIGLRDSQLRWCYTATTRAKEVLYAINPPNIKEVVKLKCNPIAKQTRCPIKFCQDQEVFSPFHLNRQVPTVVKLQCVNLINLLAETQFSLIEVDSKQYLERMYFKCGDFQFKLDVYYDGSGLYKPLKVTNNATPEDELKKIINSVRIKSCKLNYEPSSITLETLFQQLSTHCEDLGIIITNVEEFTNSYYVLYCLQTEAKFSYIQFYYNGRNQFTHALVFSANGNEDKLLSKLVQFMDLEGRT